MAFQVWGSVLTRLSLLKMPPWPSFGGNKLCTSKGLWEVRFVGIFACTLLMKRAIIFAPQAVEMLVRHAMRALLAGAYQQIAS